MAAAFRFAGLFFILLFTIPAQGGFVEKGIELAKSLAERLGNAIEEAMEHSQDSKLGITAIKEGVYAEGLLYIGEAMQSAKEEAENRTCNPAVYTSLDDFQKELTSSLDSCVNASMDITQFEKYILQQSKEMEVIEETACSGVKNVTSCLGKSITEEITCVSTAAVNLIKAYDSLSGEVKATYEEIKQLGGDAIKDIKLCLSAIMGGLPTGVSTIMKNQC